MKPKNSGTVLIYNCSGPKFSKMSQIFAMLGVRMCRVQPEQYHLPLLELAQRKGEAGQTPAEPIPENVLVFCGLNQAFLNQLLEVIRLAKLPPIHFKAILTEENKDWNSLQLVEELRKEKESIDKGEAPEA